MSARCIRKLLPLAALALLSACGPAGVEVVKETDEKQYQLAQDYKKQGRVDEALSAFLRVIHARREAPESHLEAGYIYLNTLRDPIQSIYHFDRYLKLKPQSRQSRQVSQLIETAKKEFARQLPGQPAYQGDADRIDLMDLIKTLRQEIDSLKRELIASKGRERQLEDLLRQASRAPEPQTTDAGPVAPRLVAPQGEATGAPDPSAVPRAYVVQPGDTLSSISARLYGTPSRWIDIYQANRDRLSNENALRVGQELHIP